MSAKKQAIVKVEADQMELFQTEIPDFLRQNTGSRGTENVNADDLLIPRLELVQDLSPCRKKTDQSYIPGAEGGMLYNNVTRQLYGPEVLILPVHFKKEYLVWKDRTKGGGFRGAFASLADAEEAVSRLEDGADCEIMDTAQHFCLIVTPETGKTEEIVISMSKSKAKVSRKWNSLVRMAGGDSFSRVYRMSTVSEKNNKNQDFYNLSIAAAGFPTKALFDKAVRLYEGISAGTIQIDRKVDSVSVETESEY
jgi:hypothetical protein